MWQTDNSNLVLQMPSTKKWELEKIMSLKGRGTSFELPEVQNFLGGNLSKTPLVVVIMRAVGIKVSLWAVKHDTTFKKSHRAQYIPGLVTYSILFC